MIFFPLKYLKFDNIFFLYYHNVKYKNLTYNKNRKYLKNNNIFSLYYHNVKYLKNLAYNILLYIFIILSQYKISKEAHGPKDNYK